MALDYEKEDRIAIFTINRPEAMNALNMQVRLELNEALIDFRDAPDLWVVLLLGLARRHSRQELISRNSVPVQ